MCGAVSLWGQGGTVIQPSREAAQKPRGGAAGKTVTGTEPPTGGGVSLKLPLDLNGSVPVLAALTNS